LRSFAAEARLAIWANDGFGDLKKDPARAAELAKQSVADGLVARAETGTAAVYNLGLLYDRGSIPGKVPSDATELYEKAAARDSVAANQNCNAVLDRGVFGGRAAGKQQTSVCT
jgi:hypothetical protein